MTGEGASALAGLGAVGVERLSGITLPAPSAAERASSGLLGDEEPGAEKTTDAASPGEPLFDAAATADIQGNVIPGFNKDHQRFLFFTASEVEGARAWLRWLAPRLSSMQEVLDFRREFRRERLESGSSKPSKTAIWTAFALSRAAVLKLLGEQALAEMGDRAFRQGMAARSTYLGDPATAGAPGHSGGWRIGGPDAEPDFLVIIAADEKDELDAAASVVISEAAVRGVDLAFDQLGENLPGNLAGHEHFGFKDGVSQPGVRGTTDDGEDISPRYLDPRNPHSRIFGKPGQPLVWPGQFVAGWPRQNPADPLIPDEGPGAFPVWARNGSYLVFRRLNQDVPAFWDFVARAAGEHGTDPVRFASMLVGRWPSGAPVSRAPEADDLALAGDEFAHNHFQFDDDTRGWTPSAELSGAGYAGDAHPRARSDVFGDVCPVSSHIRKVNPRDSGTDFGAPGDTFLRLMLRRGIPFGPPLAGVRDPSPDLVATERGLLFAAYMTSIEDQFEFVMRRWANSSVQPNAGGHDPIIGQSNVHGERERRLRLHASDGGERDIVLEREWVTASGGGYFFAPGISAVTAVLAAPASERSGRDES
ncbi:Dyp-type peroxidase [Microbacterium sp. 4R-513]|uniref:Dyp-type peroxidase n=1 Tax=Microbacterium sp. 4R-513 TaxID=2567934 RepID=UPI0013E128BE|nr:Dyp-type peroxidase [Microbacterium sp. 4R-513]QIG38400.1 Dyp-type peroxidase [Microbacterium sp. 4R-513]